MNTEVEKHFVSSLEKQLGIHEGFLLSLKEEDDWSCIIKAHAFVEASVSYLLIHVLNQPELLEVFSNLELSNTKTGKIAFVSALDVLKQKEKRKKDCK